MLSSTTALFVRSFRVDARSIQPHVLRLMVAGVILISLVWTHLVQFVFGAPGLTVFKSITYLNLAFITLGSIGFFATAISEEKEEDSLGLLKMAGISPVALLLGKSTTRVVNVLLMLAVQFPFVLLAITLGGVTLGQVIAMGAALAAYLIFVANLGLFCSVVGTTSRRASSMMTFFLILLLIVLPVLAQAAGAYSSLGPTSSFKHVCGTFAIWEGHFSIWSRIWAILSSGFADNIVSMQVIGHLVAAGALFGLSWAGFERFTRESHAARPIEKVFFSTQSGRVRRQSVGRAWPLALAWKDFYFVAGGKVMVIARFIIYFVLIASVAAFISATGGFTNVLTPRLVGGIMMTITLGAAALELALLAARIFREEVKAQTLPLLMTLPKTTAEIAWGKACAAGPVLAPTACYFVLGALLDAEDFATGFKNVVSSWGGWSFAAWFIFFLHLTAYLSLLVKWGALPLALFLMYFSQIFLIPMFMLINLMFASGGNRFSETLLILVQFAIVVVGTVLLEYRIASRLRTLAAR